MTSTNQESKITLIYLCKLSSHKVTDRKTKVEQKRNLKKFKKFMKLITRNKLLDQEFTMGKKKIVFNDDLPYLQAHTITYKAINGFYCETCWHKHIISEPKYTKDGTLYCSVCGSETPENKSKPIHRKEAYRLGSKNPFSLLPERNIS